MSRQNNNVPFNPAAVPRGAAPLYNPPLPGRVPVEFIAAMKLLQGKPADPHTRTPDMAAKTQIVQRGAAKPYVFKWKSSFKPVDGDDDSEDKGTGSSEGVELYDPYGSVLTESELDVPGSSHCSSEQENNLIRYLSQGRGCKKKSRWDCSDERGQLFGNETSPARRLSDKPAYSPETESFDQPSVGRPLDQGVEHSVCSPERTSYGSSKKQIPTRYGGQRTDGEGRMTEYRRETTTIRLSPPRLQRNYHHQQGHVETGKDLIQLTTEVTRKIQKNIIMDKSPITCDLCEVELANGQELEDHLDGKGHWDTLEHIQQQNSYDDLVVAFLQEVMLYKSRQCSRTIEDSALQALQENDHMIKVEMFHCAACDVFVSTSASSVQAHITCQDHLSKTKELEVQRRVACLSKAETIMKELKPQFEYFMQGGSPFE